MVECREHSERLIETKRHNLYLTQRLCRQGARAPGRRFVEPLALLAMTSPSTHRREHRHFRVRRNEGFIKRIFAVDGDQHTFQGLL